MTDAPQTTRRTIFSVPFHSALTDADLARLHSAMGMATYLSPKPGVSGASAGVAKLDLWSGLFLVRGEEDGEWALEGRTWGNPSEGLVHEWHVRAALAARALDPAVVVPPRVPLAETDGRLRAVGRAANKRSARLARRLMHLQ